eukprot:3438246-Prymnesium_polylepis.1
MERREPRSGKAVQPRRQVSRALLGVEVAQVCGERLGPRVFRECQPCECHCRTRRHRLAKQRAPAAAPRVRGPWSLETPIAVVPVEQESALHLPDPVASTAPVPMRATGRRAQTLQHLAFPFRSRTRAQDQDRLCLAKCPPPPACQLKAPVVAGRSSVLWRHRASKPMPVPDRQGCEKPQQQNRATGAEKEYVSPAGSLSRGR